MASVYHIAAIRVNETSCAHVWEFVSAISERGMTVVDPREDECSYDFRPMTITVTRIRQLEPLGYFIERSVCEPVKKSFRT
jgi:hypothetical protein